MVSENRENNITILCCGQGTQEEGMFRELVENPDSRQAAEEVLETLKRLPGGSDIVDTYYDSGVSAEKINSTANAQPGIAAYTAILHRTLEKRLGYDVTPDAASGYSLGAYTSLLMLRVLLLEHMLHGAIDRGRCMSTIEPGVYHVITAETNKPASPRRMRLTTLRGSGWIVNIHTAPNVISLSGLLRTEKDVGKRLEKSGIVNEWVSPNPNKDAKVHQEHAAKYYMPVHTREMIPHAKLFRHTERQYCKRKKEETGRPVYNSLTDSLFITNKGEILTNGKDIMNYMLYRHIVQRCDFYRTFETLREIACNCLGLGRLSFQKRYSDEMGYIEDFHLLSTASRIDEAASWYDTIMERRGRELVPERVRRKLVPAYSPS